MQRGGAACGLPACGTPPAHARLALLALPTTLLLLLLPAHAGLVRPTGGLHGLLWSAASLAALLQLAWRLPVAHGSDTVPPLRARFLRSGHLGPFPLMGQQGGTHPYAAGGGLFERIAQAVQQQEAQYAASAHQQRSGDADGTPKGGWQSLYQELSQPASQYSYWLAVPELYALATHPQILDLVNQTIGPHVMLWGGTVRSGAANGTVRGWYATLEVVDCPQSASVWVAARGGGGLLVVQGAHVVQEPPLERLEGVEERCDAPDQAAACDQQLRERLAAAGEQLATRAKAINGTSAGVAALTMGEGELLVLHGRSWYAQLPGPPAAAAAASMEGAAAGPAHGPEPRWSIVLQYASPRCAVRQALQRGVPPARTLPAAMLPCRMVVGAADEDARVVNNLVEGLMISGRTYIQTTDHLAQGNIWKHPRAAGPQPILLTWRTNTSDLLKLEHATTKGTRRQLAVAPVHTPLLEVLWAGASCIAYGVSTHPLEVHPQAEEAIFLVNGTAAVLRAPLGAQLPVKWVVGAGTFMYHPIYEPHTIVCLSREGCCTVAVKLRPRLRPTHMLVPINGPLPRPLPGSIWEPRAFNKGKRYQLMQAAVLESGLLMHLHTGSRPPGWHMPMHADHYEVFMMVLEGELLVEPNGRRVCAGEALLKPAGVAMATSAGPRGATTMVLELHARLLPPALAALAYQSEGPPALLRLVPPPGVQPCPHPRHLPPLEPPPGPGGGAGGPGGPAPPPWPWHPYPSLQYQGTWGAMGRDPQRWLAERERARTQWRPPAAASTLTPGITLVTHGDPTRLGALRRLCQLYAGPISLALLVMTEHGRALSLARRSTYSRLSSPPSPLSHAPSLQHSTTGHDPAAPAPAQCMHASWHDEADELALPEGLDVFSLAAYMPELLSKLTHGAPCALTLQLYALALPGAQEGRAPPPYPHAALRNAALAAAGSALVALVDVDMVPSARLAKWHAQAGSQQQQEGGGYTQLVKALTGSPAVALALLALEPARCGGGSAGKGAAAAAGGGGQQQQQAGCEAQVEAYSSGPKSKVVSGLQSGALLPLSARAPRSHNATDYARWLAADGAYAVKYEWPYGPPLLLATSRALWFDEAAPGAGGATLMAPDRPMRGYTLRLHLMGVQLRVPHNMWLLRVPAHALPNPQTHLSSGAGQGGGQQQQQRAAAHMRSSVAAALHWQAAGQSVGGNGGNASSLEVLSRYTCGAHANLGPYLAGGDLAARGYGGYRAAPGGCRLHESLTGGPAQQA